MGWRTERTGLGAKAVSAPVGSATMLLVGVLLLGAMLFGALLPGLGASVAHAQQSGGPLTQSQPNCQTIVQCNFARGGVYRGCISAYSCRRCRLVKSRSCGAIQQGRSVCRRVVCSWGS